MNVDLEYNSNQNEYFPIVAGPKKSKKENNKKSQNIIRMLMMTTTLVISTVVITLNIVNHVPVFLNQKVINYIESIDENNGSYNLEFSFYQNETSIKEIKLLGSSINYFPQDVPLEINETFDKDDFIIDEDNVYINYNFQDLNINYEVYFIIDYFDKSNDIKTLQTSKIYVGLSNLVVYEMDSNNYIETTILENEIYCKAVFVDLIKGSFDFMIETIYVYIDGIEYDISDYINLPLELINSDPIEIEFSIPKQESESILVEVEIMGDSYFNQEKLNIESHTYASTEIILGTAYKLAPATITLDSSNLAYHGLTINYLKFSSNGYNFTSSIEEVLPGRTVYGRITLEGMAEVEFIPQIDLLINENKISEFQLWYLDTVIYEGDKKIYLDFEFIMPNEDVDSSDIVLNGFIKN